MHTPFRDLWSVCLCAIELTATRISGFNCAIFPNGEAKLQDGPDNPTDTLAAIDPSTRALAPKLPRQGRVVRWRQGMTPACDLDRRLVAGRRVAGPGWAAYPERRGVQSYDDDRDDEVHATPLTLKHLFCSFYAWHSCSKSYSLE